jgi:hypothetical protein
MAPKFRYCPVNEAQEEQDKPGILHTYSTDIPRILHT